MVVKKGINPNLDSYSAFFDNKKRGHTELEELLRNRGVTDVYACGIAYDVCVGESAFFGHDTRTPKSSCRSNSIIALTWDSSGVAACDQLSLHCIK